MFNLNLLGIILHKNSVSLSERSYGLNSVYIKHERAVEKSLHLKKKTEPRTQFCNIFFLNSPWKNTRTVLKTLISYNAGECNHTIHNLSCWCIFMTASSNTVKSSDTMSLILWYCAKVVTEIANSQIRGYKVTYSLILGKCWHINKLNIGSKHDRARLDYNSQL